MKTPQLPLPPIAFGGAAALQRIGRPGKRAKKLRRVSAVVLLGSSVALAAATVLKFRQQGTTLDPTLHQQASVLITDGTNAISRNPMYVAMAGALSAHALWRGTARAWAPVAAFVLLLNKVQIPREEEALGDRFGSDYELYVRIVPRWIGLPRAENETINI